ncbi:2',3'-cyclic-nucleotide 2'-phosphodiesterase / 3'-nucleotidase [Natronorubrum sediminis]|uniref:2',3'-cyclic-nucleotide 2'-phosphodiesterase / 3'-nucleotidase n=1 Tax=Natronorubrum sediminis TaxID=640943 RepID=A0A1H6G4U0_9EURY|nr:5'-nucleotidase C-terminal domain-containing protein [Natronorubrum sediminis]SEH17458.1 2',3'-cyclic-nucleotide 2'-phosphodiesterase / 3'-nucleotidase [Natronorubrum sediminis]
MSKGLPNEIDRRGVLQYAGVAGVAALAGCSDASSDDENGDGDEETTSLRIIHDTHFHGLLGESEEPLNVANYFGLMEELYEDTENAFAVGNGDDLHMSVESSVFEGEHITSVLNESPVSHNAIGNHEFDNGPESLRENIADSEFTWLSANVLEDETGEAFASEEGAARYVVEAIDGVDVGFTGLAPEDTPEITSVGDDVEVIDPVTAAEDVVADLEEEGADIVILLSHLSSPVAEDLVAEVDGIDAVVGDHAAFVEEEPLEENETIISVVGDEFDYVGQLDLEIAGDKISEYAFEKHDLEELVDADEVDPHDEIEDRLLEYEDELDDELEEVIGETTEELDARNDTVRSEESNLGNWLTDVIREDVDAEIAIQNGGGIRSDELYDAGDLTRGVVVDILPFPNETVKIEITGENLEEAIETGVSSVEDGHGRFPQVSGMSFTYDADAEAGERVEEITVGGEDVDPEATYELGTNDFLMEGGDGYESLTEGEVIVPPDEGTVISALAMNRLEDEGTISPELEGRIETV